MSSIMDKINALTRLGEAVRECRTAAGLKATEVARRSGRSRDILHRLETGQDISASALLDILRAMDSALQIVPAGLPSMAQMRQRFAVDDDE